LALMGVVFVQIRGRRLSLRQLLLPVALADWAASSYLKGIPTARNDFVLVALGLGLGTTLAVLAGIFTQVTRAADRRPYSKTGVLAAVLWVAGVGTRLANLSCRRGRLASDASRARAVNRPGSDGCPEMTGLGDPACPYLNGPGRGDVGRSPSNRTQSPEGFLDSRRPLLVRMMDRSV